MNTIPAMVCWYEGMAMLPQHFQLQALRHEMLTATLARCANPWFWGVMRLEIDEAALCAGTLRVMQLQAIMPDGVPINYDISRDPPLEFDCARLLPASPDSEHTLWLALSPASRAGQWQLMNTRYRSVNSAPLPDLTSGEFPQSVPLWQPMPHLVSQHERADFICLPLIQVVYSEGGFRRNEWFAPMPALEHESYPWRHARQICLQAREKILFLNREIQLARQNQRTTDGLWLTLSLQSLQGGLVFLESLLNSGHVHPVDLYRALCLFAGQTAILTQEKTLPLLPEFDYLDMYAAFTSLFALLRNQLAHIHRRWQRLNFNRQENSFTLTLPAGIRAGDQIIIGVLMPNGCTMPAQSWLQQSIIASQPFLAVLRRQRMHGMTISPLPAERRSDWEIDNSITLFTLTLVTNWFEKETPLIISPLHETDSIPERIMLYRQEDHYDAC
ncbi:MAG TPA: type VI secretion system baseplate subunit TssK [Salmonella bongori]|uniref:Type VI secretion protein n=4 Tax=Salmonella bongori TaxID=54736 RepID=A0A0K0HA46_SALBC|nr:type VI secretion system baseplate subunit TssK [Salmonella bongori]ASG54904.1 type VI secretion protein [Salmonella bongori serovar 66:z41:- str. SA19983605]ECC9750528.1 type VI secretion system baseplate subunit TssK [Salmonella bongori]EDP8562518.1 type VI secretion system baseplate subunit TssK [Salmonella bongori]EDP8606022.1 type VI secretion system baseplate subunit TssK [Salmonella bongori]EDP8650233.1 type VI secretion system baseplate subunit TssK [Salmonella bongori]